LAYYHAHRDFSIIRNRIYKKANSEKVAAKEQQYRVKHRLSLAEKGRMLRRIDPAKSLWLAARRRARGRGLDFDILPADIIIPNKCPILGFQLEIGADREGRKGPNRRSPSLDRLDSSKGYVKGNIQVISYMANVMKQNATPAELRAFAVWVQGSFGGSP
jgi:hypothetical protein